MFDEGWYLRDYGSDETVSRETEDVDMTFYRETVKVILTFSSEVTKRRSLPAVLAVAEVRYPVVLEVLDVTLTPIKNELKNLTKLEAQYGSAEFLWINDRALTSRVINFVNSGSNATKGKSYADSIEGTLFR